MLHDRDHVARHLDLGIGGVVRAGCGLERPAIAAQIRADDGEPPGQLRCDQVPHRMGLRVAMQQQQRRPGAAMTQAHGAARRRHFSQVEAVKEHR